MQELASILTKSTVEATVGTKSVDLILPYNAATHSALTEFLAANSEDTVALNDGDVLAIEVEISNPDRTIPSNAAKNREAGIVTTVVAVLPKSIAEAMTVIAGLEPGLRSTLVLVDVLRLLDHVRAATGEES